MTPHCLILQRSSEWSEYRSGPCLADTELNLCTLPLVVVSVCSSRCAVSVRTVHLLRVLRVVRLWLLLGLGQGRRWQCVGQPGAIVVV
jgi:hypothetical protein